jgi:outer membrane immunogenic protein
MSGCIVRAGIAAALLTVSATSYAADVPVRMPTRAPVAFAVAPTWAGPYIGGFAGYAQGDSTATAPRDFVSGFFYNFRGASYELDPKGFFGGATVGLNFQSGPIVFGFEGEGGYLGLRGSAIEPNDLPTTNDTVTRLTSGAYGALYGRLGIAAGNVLFYGRGGGAFLDAKASTIDPCVAPPATCGTTTLRMRGERLLTGWSAGGGVEVMLGSRWSLKAEYAYFDFGGIRVSGASSVPGEVYRQTIGVEIHTAKVGLNFRWGGTPVVARY